MNRSVSLLIVFDILLSCSPYSEQFAERYSQDIDSIKNDAIIVYPQGGEFCFVENDIIRQFFYPGFRAEYKDYGLFLLDLLRGRICIPYDGEKEIARFDKAPSCTRRFLRKKYLVYDSSRHFYIFKNGIQEKEMYGIIKMMFDSGYYVFFSDFDAEYTFCEESVLYQE